MSAPSWAGLCFACARDAGLPDLLAGWFAGVVVVYLRERTKLGKALLRLRA
ncbi:hypothetical protein ACIOD2_41140 [Amycolatopsis sp. NPDC088138]|uniref:hypothetical protein n=1 Tax=Amycolatopsis sp. NPDC088138 TaxID=3363938 RepID=UPI003830518F